MYSNTFYTLTCIYTRKNQDEVKISNKFEVKSLKSYSETEKQNFYFGSGDPAMVGAEHRNF